MRQIPSFTELYQPSPDHGPTRPVLSFEFFPPKREEDLENTKSLIRRLADLQPNFMTVTYGAGGGTRKLTRALVSFIINELQIPAAAHLTCVNHTKAEIDEILDSLAAEGISHIVALRGDPPAGSGPFIPTPEGFSCARDLVSHIKRRGGFSCAVAGYPEKHPQALSFEAEMAYLKEKVDCGGEIVISQLFFESRLYSAFLNRTNQAGIRVPVVPGIMPISNVAQIERITKLCGASVPKPLQEALTDIREDTDAVLSYGTSYAIKLCRELLSLGAPGLHLYTLNKAEQVEEIVSAVRRFAA